MARAHHVEIALARRVGDDRHVEIDVDGLDRLVERRVERLDDGGQPVDRAGIAACSALTPAAGLHRRDDGDLVPDRIEDDDDGRPDQDGIGKAERIGIRRGQLLHLAHHVVAEIAEYAGRHRRQAGRQVDPRFLDQAAQRRQRRLRRGSNSRPVRRAGSRLISARAPKARKIRSGSMPMIE